MLTNKSKIFDKTLPKTKSKLNTIKIDKSVGKDRDSLRKTFVKQKTADKLLKTTKSTINLNRNDRGVSEETLKRSNKFLIRFIKN